ALEQGGPPVVGHDGDDDRRAHAVGAISLHRAADYKLLSMSAPSAFRDSSSVLVVAHPGHELRVHGWLTRTRPRVLVLTDGSGHTGTSRLDSSARIVAEAKAAPGCLFGSLSDREAYRAVLSGDLDFFAALARRIAEELGSPAVDTVVGDAAEGYNPMHDICRFLIDAAAALADRERPGPLRLYDFPLAGPPRPAGFQAPRDGVCLRLSEEEFARKLAAARSYAPLDGDIAAALREHGEESFRLECLRSLERGRPFLIRQPPFYETYGEKQVAAGHYAKVVRYQEHVRPIEEALRKLSHGRSG
ncbi:MAG: hypothetical protein ACRD00_08195, partial [Thermoanaerobaculia bacterium]